MKFDEEKAFKENEKFNKAMREQYPNFFGKRFDNTWPWAGWQELIRNLIKDIDEYCYKNGLKGFKILQVKEKFGGLRFYYAFDRDYAQITDYVDRLVTEAEQKAAQTCEYCGEPGKIQGKYWLKCVCPDHADN